MAGKPSKSVQTITRSASSKEIAVSAPGMTIDILRGVLEQNRFELLMTPPPPHAIRKRPDGYDYLPHGYVTTAMNQIFGFDWDHKLLPVFDGNIYQFIPADEAKLPTQNPCVVVFGELNIRINRFKNGTHEVITTITKTGFGGAEVRKKMERADAVKAAQSDSRKVCAAQLGPRLGLTLYYDDEAKIAEYEEQMQREAEAKELAEKLQRAESILNSEGNKMNPKQVADLVGLTVPDLAEAGLI